MVTLIIFKAEEAMTLGWYDFPQVCGLFSDKAGVGIQADLDTGIQTQWEVLLWSC